MDYGGVLTSPVLESWGAFCAAEGLDVEAFRRVVLHAARTEGSVFARIETGAISAEEFDRELAVLLSEGCGVPVAAAGLKQRLFAALRPDEAMIAAVRAAGAGGVRTGLLSNSWGGGGYPTELLEELFDAVVISGEVGLRKPDAAIFRLAAARTGVEAADCVFVDDFTVNIEGAEAVGMTGVLHRAAAETVPKLGMLLGVPMP